MTPDTDTYDALCEVMDMEQRNRQLLFRLCEHAGIDPHEAERLPDAASPEDGHAKAA